MCLFSSSHSKRIDKIESQCVSYLVICFYDVRKFVNSTLEKERERVRELWYFETFFSWRIIYEKILFSFLFKPAPFKRDNIIEIEGPHAYNINEVAIRCYVYAQLILKIFFYRLPNVENSISFSSMKQAHWNQFSHHGITFRCKPYGKHT